MLNFFFANMNRIFIIIISIAAAMCVFTSCNGSSENPESSDSLYTAEYISNICRTQPQRALELLDTAEQRGLMTPTNANGMRALIYNNGLNMTKVSMFYANKAYENAVSDNDSILILKSLKFLIALNFVQSRYGEVVAFATEGLNIAKNYESPEFQAYFLMFMGLSVAETESVDAGIELIDRSIAVYAEIAQRSDANWNNFDDYYYSLAQKANIFMDKGRYEETLKILPLCENAISRMTDAEDVADMRTAEVYGMYMTSYLGLNMPEKAHEYATKFNTTNLSRTPKAADVLIPYLLAIKDYDEALKRIKDKREIIEANGDTLTYYFVNTILECERDCYEGKGNIRKAFEISKQMKVMTDSLYLRENNANIAELSTIYKTKDMEIQLLMKEKEMARHKTIFIVTAIIVIILGAFIAVLLYYNRKINRKNKIAAAMISELTEAHDELRMQKIAEPQPLEAEEETDKEKLLFDQIDRIIVKQKLFLQPGFSRDEAAALAKITPKHLSALFQQFANGFPDYINTLRLEYSVTILKTKPNYTVEGISQESGFSSRQTFHRLFVEKYGLTPTEFRS